MPENVLLAGFGNTYRRDDGLGFTIVNALRRRLGRPVLDPLDDGFDDLGHAVDTVVLHQLVPELAETVAGYDLVIFVDAHVGSVPEEIRVMPLDVVFETPLVSHQFRPETVLALAQQMYDRAPEGILLSVRGYDFEFGEGLSEPAAALVPEALARIEALIEARLPGLLLKRDS